MQFLGIAQNEKKKNKANKKATSLHLSEVS